MATPAATASIAATPPPAAVIPPAANVTDKKEFPSIVEGVKQELAAKSRANSQYVRLLRQYVATFENPIEASKKEELLKRLVEETKKQIENPNKVVKKETREKKPGIENKVDELTKKVNLFFGEIASAVKAFTSTKDKDDLDNIALTEKSKGKDIKLIDRNGENVQKFIGKNNELMNEFIALYKTLNHKINTKKKLIAKHIRIEPSDEIALAKIKKKFGFSDQKVNAHFNKQNEILKIRENALKHLELLNTGITTAFEQVQRETQYYLDCWVSKKEVSRTKWRMGVGYSTDSELLKKMNRIENIKNLLPKPVGKPAAAPTVETKPAKKEEKPAATAPAAAEHAPTPPPAAAAASTPATAEKKEKKRKKNKNKGEVVEAAP